MKLITKSLLLAGLVLSFSACTDLEEDLREDLTGEEADEFFAENADVSALLQTAYDGMQLPYQDQAQFWAAQEHTSDEVIGPTRGPDWDDNGVWRVLHDHTWGPDHAFLEGAFNSLLSIVFSATNVLDFNPSPQEAAEARMLRAFVMLSIADGWDQVPFREPGDNLLEAPRVLTGQEAVDFVISEVNEVMNDLPDGPAYRANKDAAKVLLMKTYLQRGAFENRENPTFDPGDMQQVINLADEIINSGKYSLSANYFDNFAPNNDLISTENIFTNQNLGGERSGNVRSRWFCTLHYNQNPSGWNGFTTIADFYNKFEEVDPRVGGAYDGITEVGGVNVGFLVGQQFDAEGTALEDRRGNPLAFTPEVKLQETGDDLEVTGIRVIKYPIDYNGGDNADNDYVFYRYADVLLMKAEALLRTGDEAGALALVNEIRTARGVDALSSIDLDILLDERGRELYWEGHRRTDLIRFGKFLGTWNEKPASGAERLRFAIPPTALAVNPNLTQNPGY